MVRFRVRVRVRVRVRYRGKKRLSPSLVTTLIRILHPIGQSLTGRIC